MDILYGAGNVENPVYGFGSGKRGQLGISTDKIKSTSLPQMTMGLENHKITSINANGDHSSALSGKPYFKLTDQEICFYEYL